MKVPPCCNFQESKSRSRMEELISSDIELIEDVVAKITGGIEQAGCAEGLENAELALREALANAIIHGNGSNPAKAVRICVAVEEGCGIRITVKDAGSGFNPRLVPDPLAGENLLSGHGRGIFLIQRLMDDVRFEFGSGTELHMRRSASQRL